MPPPTSTRTTLSLNAGGCTTQEIKDLRTEIHHIGNNINQIARSANAGIATAEDARRGPYLLDQVYVLMYQVAKK